MRAASPSSRRVGFSPAGWKGAMKIPNRKRSGARSAMLDLLSWRRAAYLGSAGLREGGPQRLEVSVGDEGEVALESQLPVLGGPLLDGFGARAERLPRDPSGRVADHGGPG